MPERYKPLFERVKTYERDDERPGLSLNAVVCLGCFQAIESSYRWHFNTCCCGKVSVDGGLDYLKRSFQSDAEWIDISYNERETIAYRRKSARYVEPMVQSTR